MAHYYAQGRLHMADTRDEAVEQAVQNWAQLTKTAFDQRGSADLRRLQQGDPPTERPRAAPPRTSAANSASSKSRCPDVHYGVRAGDRIAMIDQHHEPGVERIENGARGEVLDINDAGEVLVQFDVTGQWRTARRR